MSVMGCGCTIQTVSEHAPKIQHRLPATEHKKKRPVLPKKPNPGCLVSRRRLSDQCLNARDTLAVSERFGFHFLARFGTLDELKIKAGCQSKRWLFFVVGTSVAGSELVSTWIVMNSRVLF